ncbi:MAG: hypothetical protein QM473_20960, partial [Acidobacteriota bacterium]|nr:hypothetical protein [Acidobacteriota bacterium]
MADRPYSTALWSCLLSAAAALLVGATSHAALPTEVWPDCSLANGLAVGTVVSEWVEDGKYKAIVDVRNDTGLENWLRGIWLTVKPVTPVA